MNCNTTHYRANSSSVPGDPTAGVPTARTTHARVWLNGRDLGLYVLKEGYDRTFLKRHFKNSNGNLYDGGFLHDITDRLHRKPGEGDVPNYRDLRAVVAASREPDQARRFTRLEQVLDVDRFLSFVAIEILTEHWDGYTIKRNNYRVYHDPDSGRCVFIPHGMDQMFWRDDRALIPGQEPEGGLVARALLETEEGRNRYRERLNTIVTNLFTTDRLTNHLRQLQARLRPVLASISEEKARAYDNAVAHLRREILARLSRVHRMMSDKPPVTLVFLKGGLAPVKDWRAVDFRETSLLEQIPVDGRTTLHVQATTNGPCTGSWRSSLRISPGHYVFEGRLRTKGVVAIAEDRSAANTGIGAGIRISKPKGQNSGRGKGAIGDTDWQPVRYEFTVGDQTGDYDLVCELRAAQGEAWFDLPSLQLRRISQ